MMQFSIRTCSVIHCYIT